MNVTIGEKAWVISLMLISAAFVAGGLIWLLFKSIQTIRYPAKKRKPGMSRLLMFSCLLIGALWCLRFAVGLFNFWYPPENYDALNPLEEVLNSLVHALQTFSMDEDYTHYILWGRRMVGALTDCEGWVNAFGGYTAALNVLAPVIGGAALFEILANIFPKIMLRVVGLQIWRKRCYFSELNPTSLALATSLLREDYPWYKKPVLIFTDAYADDESETSSEMLLEAKMLGAVCVRDDLCHVFKRGFGKRVYYLMDENEVENLRTLAELAGDENRKFIKRAEIYLLTQNDAYTQIEKELRQRLCGVYSFSPKELPRIMPVQGYRNLVTNLLVELPLYEPIVHRYRNKDGEPVNLHITILGTGVIGTEMFLAVYWMGQMLDCRLKITVISQDAPEQFRKKLDYINPEILKTVDWNDEGKKDSLLKYNSSGDYADYYASVYYHQADFATGSSPAQDESPKNEERNVLELPALRNSDYIVVALGSDEDNITVAEKLRLTVGHEHISRAQRTPYAKNTVIAYVVYDADLCQALNERRHNCSCQANTPDIYMHAFGSLQQVYSCTNLMMTKHQYMAEMAGESYSSMQKRTDLNYAAGTRVGVDYENANYNFWANIARTVHMKYKVFSLGWIGTSVFDDTKPDCPEHRKAVAEAVTRYKRLNLGFRSEGDAQAAQYLKSMEKRLAWLEHRRWNAYTRTCGFRYSDACDIYCTMTNSHKHMSMKLHPCLVESKNPDFDSPEQDMLDLLAVRLVELKLQKEKFIKDDGFKQYDSPNREFDDFCALDDVWPLISGCRRRAFRLCRKGKISGAFCLADGTWVLPRKSAMDWGGYMELNRAVAEYLPKAEPIEGETEEQRERRHALCLEHEVAAREEEFKTKKVFRAVLLPGKKDPKNPGRQAPSVWMMPRCWVNAQTRKWKKAEKREGKKARSAEKAAQKARAAAK